jgi:carbon storage regulator
MLVISRRKNETIILNRNITVTVMEIHGNRVKLGIVAPEEISIRRIECEEENLTIQHEPFVARIVPFDPVNEVEPAAQTETDHSGPDNNPFMTNNPFEQAEPGNGIGEGI